MGRYLVSSPVAVFISVAVKMVGTRARSRNREGPYIPAGTTKAISVPRDTLAMPSSYAARLVRT